MNTNIERMKLIFIGFLGVFALGIVAVIVVTVVWIVPQKKCTAAHKWWDYGERVCAQPVLISDITGRVITDEKALAEAKKAIGRPVAPAAKAPAAPSAAPPAAKP
jgi:hypothetical protein